MILARTPLPALIPQLDAIRTIAVGSVWLAHFGGAITRTSADIGLDFGAIGVRLFFVLSGFLITRILVRSRIPFYGASAAKKIPLLGRFYVRRTLRIFPLYYMVVAAVFFLGFQESVIT